ncbi:MAG: gamma-glutamyltranspeptidase / glutathione hydrolase [Gaiellales bacterium]|nr:gamma-glutamyltranspeptidase / glutathione hydrolase [Gaiellales bacterium]
MSHPATTIPAVTWTASPSRPAAVGAAGMVATSQPLAAAAGAEVLRGGGNAMDAALAAAGVLAVTEPNQCGLGGDLFAIVLRDGHAPVGLNASGRSPAQPGDDGPELFGPRSVTVPGCAAGWADLAARFATRGLESALAPAIDLARGGFAMSPRNTEIWNEDWPLLDGEAAKVFRPRPVFSNPAMAASLENVAAGRFYQGAIAESIGSVCWLSAEDLAAHENDWVEPLAFDYRGQRLLELPPNGQGSIAGWALESLPSPSLPDQVEALAAAYARGYATIGGTAYVCAADAGGMAVSLIQSIFYGFGSQVIVPGHGFMLQNRASGFVLEPGHPNCFAPAKRPFHTIIPAALTDAQGRWTAVLGVTGGQFQPQGHVQLLVNMLEHGLDPQAALDAPRYRLEEDGSVSLEPPLESMLVAFGRPAAVVADVHNFGNGHVIVRDADGLLRGGSEPRRDGIAIGV